jgi:hypothetical protein
VAFSRLGKENDRILFFCDIRTPQKRKYFGPKTAQNWRAIVRIETEYGRLKTALSIQNLFLNGFSFCKMKAFFVPPAGREATKTSQLRKSQSGVTRRDRDELGSAEIHSTRTSAQPPRRRHPPKSIQQKQGSPSLQPRRESARSLIHNWNQRTRSSRHRNSSGFQSRRRHRHCDCSRFPALALH